MRIKHVLFGIMLALAVMITGPVNAEVASSVDLGDIVGGGDGSGSGTYNTGVDARTGGPAGTTWAGNGNAGGSVFDAVAYNPLIDGVFVPTNSAAVPTTIATSGLSFQFPATNGFSWDAIRNGVSTLETNQQINPIYDANGTVITVGVGAHANSGITFDLDAIRVLYPGLQSFTGNVGGIPSPVRCGSGTAVAHILLDGTSVFSQRVWNTAAQSTNFSIPIDPADRFLTLAATDMGSYGCDKAYFGNALISFNSNAPPTANAGDDQSIRAGETVHLNGGGSFDDNTNSAALEYSWSFAMLPGTSSATLIDADTATPHFVSDVAGTYVVSLVVTDEGALASVADLVEISSDNLAPTAAAGDDLLVITGTNVELNGTNSSDPEMDPLAYSWAISSAPMGSSATINAADMAVANLTVDLEGVYEVTLGVADYIGAGTPDSMVITATTAQGFAENRIMAASSIVANLTPAKVTTKGNQRALLNFLSQAVAAIQKGDIDKAIDKLNKSIERTDGCETNGVPDGNGPGRDWITDCDAQAQVLSLLKAALGALTP